MKEGERVQEKGENYLLELYENALKGDLKSFEKLNGIAFGRNDIPLSRKLITSIESEKVQFKPKEDQIESDLSYGIKHFVNYLRVKVRQVEVSIEHAQPPVGSSFEDFPNLPVVEAARLMGLTDEIRLQDWPKSARKEMKKVEIVRPDGRRPEHPNV